ncbi:MAG: hypothetical protein R2777_08930 [Chitinophagales bacterium]
MKRFDIVYDKNTTVINVNLEMGYEWDEKLKSLLTFDLNLYERMKPKHGTSYDKH